MTTMVGGGLRDGGIKWKGERTHAHGHSVVIVGGSVRGLNGNGKNTKKTSFSKIYPHLH